MRPLLKKILQYIGLFLLSALLLYLSLRALSVGDENKWQILWQAWENADKKYLWLMALLLMVSHVIRAWRWQILLQPSNHHVGFWQSLLSVTIGYLVNLAVPRGGEISRCYYLYRLEKTPVDISFGTVVVERIADVVCLLILLGIAFVAEWTKLMNFIHQLPIEFSFNVWWILSILLLLFFVVWGIKKLNQNEKVRAMFNGFKVGLRSVFHLKNKGLFLTQSIAIWLIYFVMSYCVLHAFSATQDLGIRAVLALFALGSIAMAMPLPGGTGSYHTIVPLGLTALYGISQTQGISFVFVFHAWQTFWMIATGFLSLLIAHIWISWKARQPK